MHERDADGSRIGSGLSRRDVLKTSSVLAGVTATAGCSIQSGLDAVEEIANEAETPLLDPESVDWVADRATTSERFEQMNDDARADGLMLVELGVDTTTRDYYGVWHENVRHVEFSEHFDWEAHWDLAYDEFEGVNDDLEADYRLVDQVQYFLPDETVGDDGRCYGGIWLENPDEFEWRSSQVVLDGQFDEMAANYETQLDPALVPVDVEGYWDEWAEEVKYAWAWVENVDDREWELARDMTVDEFESANDSKRSEGYRLVDVSVYANDGTCAVAAIWVENTDRNAFQGSQDGTDDGDGRAWDAHVDLTRTAYSDTVREMHDRGYRPVSLSLVDAVGGAGSHAAAWRQNSMRPSWADRADADDELLDFITDHDLPSISAAIYQDGVNVYRRGFGYRDIDEQRPADARTRYRLASVSKPIGGLLGFRLQEAGDVDLTADETSDYLPLGDAHEHTLADLLAHHGCIPHYAESTVTTGEYDHYESAVDAAEAFDYWDEELIEEPVELDEDGDGEDEKSLEFGEVDEDDIDLGPDASECVAGEAYRYSTAGYTLLGAAYEEATGTVVDDLVREELSEPFDLHSLRREDRREDDPHRARIYEFDDDVDQTYPGEDDDDYVAWAKNVALEEGDPGPDDDAWEYVDSNSWSVLGAGLESHVTDLARLGQLVLDNQILEESSRDEMWEPYNPDVEPQRALGWHTDTLWGIDRVGHDGSNTGGNASLMVFPEDDVVVAVQSNRQSEDNDHVKNAAVDLAITLDIV
ncbi:serine hydrolase [Haloarchaeobius salinus]|uniref:serine hydrolase n=1 Tax=Haloarchaeobius salinus TaxID=1198298 RepID=UPI00210C187E|nr:serine hydrolase [Haloarchaeobius salinus]